MKLKIYYLFLILFTSIGMSTLSSCRGKAGVKAVEAAQKAFKKAPKSSSTLKGGALLESGRYADDAIRVVNEMDYDNEEDELEYDDSYYDRY